MLESKIEETKNMNENSVKSFIDRDVKPVLLEGKYKSRQNFYGNL